jgi:hypothetical protein
MPPDGYTPNPGSAAAIAMGCTCPVLDNAYGRGAYGGALIDGQPQFWIVEGCPVHDPKEAQNG